MTPAEAVDLVNRIELRGLLRDIGAELRAMLATNGDLVVEFAFPASDRSGVDVRCLVMRREILGAALLRHFAGDPRSLAKHHVRQLVFLLLVHELDEDLWLDGVQLNDPHDRDV